MAAPSESADSSDALQGQAFSEISLSTAAELFAAITPSMEDRVYGTIYRGQANSRWPLIPRAQRKQSGVERYFKRAHLTVDWQIYYEAQMLLVFLGHCDRIGLPVPNDSIARRRFFKISAPPYCGSSNIRNSGLATNG